MEVSKAYCIKLTQQNIIDGNNWFMALWHSVQEVLWQQLQYLGCFLK